ncbi:hypothetical protein T439DRAFT_375789 [Meredithblackwellia eburnea MCA 4105]
MKSVTPPPRPQLVQLPSPGASLSPDKRGRLVPALPNPESHPFKQLSSDVFGFGGTGSGVGIGAAGGGEGKLRGPFKVFCTDSGIKALRKNHDSMGIITKKLNELSEGHFSESNAKKINNSLARKEVPIYEAKLSRNLRLVWQISVMETVQDKVYEQIVLVWSVETHQSLDAKNWEKLASAAGMKGRQYIRMCKARSSIPRVGHGATNVFKPLTFQQGVELIGDDDGEDDPEPPDRVNWTDEEKLQFHEMLTLSKLVEFDRSVLASVVSEDSSHAFLFAVTPQEAEIIWAPTSTVTVGRSGSGKTTALVMKIYHLHSRLAGMAQLSPSSRRQAFITQSPLLAQHVREYFKSLLRTQATSILTREELLSLVPGDLVDEEGEKGLVVAKRFTELREWDFPLFTGWEDFLSLIEEDLGLGPKTLKGRRGSVADTAKNFDSSTTATSSSFFGNSASSFNSSTTASKTSGSSYTTSFLSDLKLTQVDSSVFTSWWSSFDQRLTANLDPTLVWTEILGIVKGSSGVARNDKPYLTEEQYLELSERGAPAFVGKREVVFRILKAYQRLKAERGMWDAADRTHRILKALEELDDEGNGGVQAHQLKIAFLAIDEAQDLLLLDYQLLRKLCPSPTGLTIVGDTAQTIFAGSSFRFQDLTSMLYVEEQTNAAIDGRPPSHLKQFQLTKNFRSHQGITRVANVLVRAITTLFPNSIDVLKDEESAIDGPKPLWLEWGENVRFIDMFKNQQQDSASNIDFGAKHCIIVRDENARTKLRDEIGDGGLILTVFESKGLEFDSCLMYCFFSDSPATPAQWDVLFNLVKRPPPGKFVPTFDPEKHAVLQRELQRCYVSTTRARKTLWIYDEDGSSAMKHYLDAFGLIKIGRPAEGLPSLPTSTAEDWIELGKRLSKQRVFKEAALSFSKGGASFLSNVAHAQHHICETVTLSKALNPSTAALAEGFTNAAKYFSEAAREAPNEGKRIKCHLSAAECYSKAKKLLEAALSYYSAKEYEKAASSYRRGGDFERAVAIVQEHGELISEPVKDAIIEVSKLQFVRAHKLDLASQLFDDVDDFIEFLRQFGFTAARKQIFQQIKAYSRVAEACLDEGDFVEAASFFLKASKPAEAKKAFVLALWELSSLGSVYEPGVRENGRQILQQAEKLNTGPKQDLALKSFRALFSQVHDGASLTALAQEHPTSSAFRLLLAHAGIVENLNQRKPATLTNVIELVESVRIFSAAAFDLCGPDGQLSLDTERTRLVFGANPVSSDDGDETNVFRLHPRSLLRRQIVTAANEQDGVSSEFHASQVQLTALSLLRSTVIAQLEKLDAALKLSTCLSPSCERYNASQSCDARCDRPHLPRDTTTPGHVNQVRAVLKVAELFREYLPQAHANRDTAMRIQREWMERLLALSIPAHVHLQSGFSHMADELDPDESERYLQLIGKYTVERLWELRDPTKPYIVHSFLLSSVAAMEVASHHFISDVDRFPLCATRWLGPDLLFGDRQSSIFWVLVSGLRALLTPPHTRDGLPTITPGALFDSLNFISTGIRRGLRIEVKPALFLLQDIVFLALLGTRATTSSNTRDAWHGLVLPRSCAKSLLRLHRTHDFALNKNFLAVLHDIIGIIGDFIFALYGGPNIHDYGIYLRPREFKRQLFISRLCELLVLIGINYPPIRPSILLKFSEIDASHLSASSDWPGGPMPFIVATNWPVLGQALLEPRIRRDISDELVAFNLPGALPNVPKSVRLIRGASLESIFTALSPRASNLSAAAAPFNPTARTTLESGIPEDIGSENKIEQRPEATPKQIEAVTRLQKWLRARLHATRSRQKPSPLAKTRLKLYLKHNDVSRKFSQSDGRLKRQLLVRGPFVELLFSLHETLGKVVDLEKQLKRNVLPEVEHEALETVMLLLKNLSSHNKTLRNAIKLSNAAFEKLTSESDAQIVDILAPLLPLRPVLAAMPNEVDILFRQAQSILPALLEDSMMIVVVWLQSLSRNS